MSDAKQGDEADKQVKEDQAEAAEKAEKSLAPKTGPAWMTFAGLAAVSVVSFVAYSIAASSLVAFFILTMVATAALVAGILVGFLFGLPRMLGRRRRGPAKEGEPAEEPGGYDPSNSLEQLADWLTKILVGVGLVEFRKALELLATFGDRVATAVGRPEAHLLGQLLLIVFVVLGLLASFLWTRIYYPSIQAGADIDVWSLVRRMDRAEDEVKNVTKVAGDIATGRLKKREGDADEPAEVPEPSGDAKPEAAGPDRPAVPATARRSRRINMKEFIESLPEDVRDKVDRFRKWDSEDWKSDPNDLLFGSGPQEASGRRLTAAIDAKLPNGLSIEVALERTPGADPLTEPVLILLHPTFGQSRMAIHLPANNRVEDLFFSKGHFTVVGIADGGKTILAYPLRQLPGASQRFKNS